MSTPTQRRQLMYIIVHVPRREYGYLGPSLQQAVVKIRQSPAGGGGGGAVAVVTCTPPLVPSAPATLTAISSHQPKTIGEYCSSLIIFTRRAEF